MSAVPWLGTSAKACNVDSYQSRILSTTYIGRKSYGERKSRFTKFIHHLALIVTGPMFGNVQSLGFLPCKTRNGMTSVVLDKGVV